jgi:hypothetical protein
MTEQVEGTVIELTPEQVGEAFRTVMLEENYNFLEEDLVLLANTFVKAAAPMIIKAERDECIKFVKSLNELVAQALKNKREAL